MKTLWVFKSACGPTADGRIKNSSAAPQGNA
nr:MAG TPA: hypothetical protein [Caudoviricetes sp.]